VARRGRVKDVAKDLALPYIRKLHRFEARHQTNPTQEKDLRVFHDVLENGSFVIGLEGVDKISKMKLIHNASEELLYSFH